VRGGEAQSHFAAADAQYGHFDPAIDHNAFSDSPSQDEHLLHLSGRILATSRRGKSTPTSLKVELASRSPVWWPVHAIEGNNAHSHFWGSAADHALASGDRFRCRLKDKPIC
jgi:hypothetical protein